MAKTDPSDFSATEHGSRPYRNSNGRFLHENMGDDLIELEHARLIGGAPAIWNNVNKRYELGLDVWDRAIIRRCEGTTKANRNEVRAYLDIVAPRFDLENTNLVACKNYVLDPFKEGFGTKDEAGNYIGVYQNSPELNLTNVLSIDWDPTAYDEPMDRFLDSYASNDPLVRVNIEEVIAACIYHGSEIQMLACFVGPGGNGKSGLFDAFKELLGKDNRSTVDLEDLGVRFGLPPIVGKLANIGDDISSELIPAKPLAVVKKIVTGNEVMVEEKCMPKYEVKPYCTLVFSANEFPRLGDVTKGMLDRIHGIELSVNFRDNPDIRIMQPRTIFGTDAAKQYMLNLALKRLPEVVARGGFTQTEYSESHKQKVLLDNDSVAFFADEKVTRGDVVDQTVESVYLKYKNFCEEVNVKAVSQRKFTSRINRIYGLTTEKDMYIVGSGKQLRAFREPRR